MPIKTLITANPFKALLDSLWERGEDGEILAREIAETLAYAIVEGKGESCNKLEEFERLLSLSEPT